MAGEEKKEPTPEEKAAAAAQAEIKKWQDEQQAKETKALEERDAKAITAYKGEIGKLIDKEPNKFEYCKFNGQIAQDLVYETILEIMKEEPTIEPYAVMKEALDLVENYYEGVDESMSTIKKRKRGDVAPPVPEVPLKPEMPGRSRSQPTLTNKATATVASVKSTRPSNESAGDKRARLEQWLRTGQKP